MDKRNPGSFPASQHFADMQKLQEWNTKRKYVKSFKFTTVAGTNTFQAIQFPGMARFLLGWTVWDDSNDVQNTFTLNLNNEDVITDTSWAEFCKILFSDTNTLALVIGSSFKDEYFSYPRALNGNDSVKITYTAVTGGHIAFNFYFKNNLDIFEV